MADDVKNRQKYYAYAIALLLTTRSGLHGDVDALDPAERTPEKLKELILYNLYNKKSGVQNGHISASELPQNDVVLNDVVDRLDYTAIIVGWQTLTQASTSVNYAIKNLLDYDPGGSCPGFLEQPELLRRMGSAGGVASAA